MKTTSDDETASSRPPAIGIRERNRRELTAEILASATRHLIEHGASDLSLRAITRDLGMASSAIYRYFASRDDLLTALIIEAYNDLGEQLEIAEAATPASTSLKRRWHDLCSALRRWAIDNPQRWALIYGTPIVGYAAPEETIDGAIRATAPLVNLLAERAQHCPPPTSKSNAIGVLDQTMRPTVSTTGHEVSEESMIEGLNAWATLVGLIGLELFGHLNNVVADPDHHFEIQVDACASHLRLGS